MPDLAEPTLEELTLKEQLMLCARTEQRCVERLERLSDRFKDQDPELGEMLAALLTDEHGHAVAVKQMEDSAPWPQVWHLDETAIDQILERYLPSLASPAIPKDPKSVLQFVHSVEGECIRFYEKLRDLTDDQESKKFFNHMAELEAAHRPKI